MAIEPIKGFYVHDEVTDTDGVARYDFNALEKRISASTSHLTLAMERKAIDSSWGIAADSTTRLKTVDFITETSGLCAFYSLVGYSLAVYVYTHSHSFVGCWNGTSTITGSIPWLKEVNLQDIFNIDNTYLLLVVLRKDTNGTITTDENINLVACSPWYEQNGAVDKKVGIFFNKYTNAKLFEQGSILSASGSTSDSYAARIRTSNYLNKNIVKIEAKEPYQFGIFAYRNKKYFGCWNGEKYVTNTLVWHISVDIKTLSTEHPELDFKIAVRKTRLDYSDVPSITPSEDGDSIIFTELCENSDNISIFGNYVDEKKMLWGADWTTKITDYILIPQHNPYGNYMYDPFKYTVPACKTSGTFVAGCTALYFYNDNFELLSTETAPTTVETPKAAKYCKVEFSASSSKYYLTFNNDGALPTYTAHKPEFDANMLPNLADVIHNSDGAKTNIINTALQYVDNENFGYGNHYTAFHEVCEKVKSDGAQGDPDTVYYEGEKFQIDCSAFTKLCLQNITPNNSRYYSDQNKPSVSGYRFNNKVEYDTEYQRLTANKLAKYAYDNGFLYVVENDLSNVEVGDLLFRSNQSTGYNFFENIGHAMIVVRTWTLKTNSPKRCTIAEVGGSFPPASIGNFTKTVDDNVIYGARFPLPNPALPIESISEEVSEETISNTFTEGQSIDFTAISLTKNLVAGKTYTLVFKADVASELFPRIAINNGNKAVHYVDSSYYKNKDGRFCLPFFISASTTITEPDKVYLGMRAETAGTYSATLYDATLYEGFISDVW